MSDYNYTPNTLIDEVSSTEYYIGISNNGSNINSPTWKIRKVIKIGTTWNTSLYPNGDQGFSFIWNNRAIYSYK